VLDGVILYPLIVAFLPTPLIRPPLRVGHLLPQGGEGEAHFVIATPAFASGHCQRTPLYEGGNAGRKSLAFLSVNSWRSQCAPPALLSRSVASTFAWPAAAKDPDLGVHHPAVLPQHHQPGRRRFPLIPGAHQGSRWKRICTKKYAGGQGEVDRSGVKKCGVKENNGLGGKWMEIFVQLAQVSASAVLHRSSLRHRSGMDSRVLRPSLRSCFDPRMTNCIVGSRQSSAL